MSKKWLATQPAILPRSDTSSPVTKGGHPVSSIPRGSSGRCDPHHKSITIWTQKLSRLPP